MPELIAAIEAYLQAHNEDPTPFLWTATADSILEKVCIAPGNQVPKSIYQDACGTNEFRVGPARRGVPRCACSGVVKHQNLPAVTGHPYAPGHRLVGDANGAVTGLHRLQHAHVAASQFGHGAALIIDHVQGRAVA